MGRPDAGEAAGLGFDHGAEGVVTRSALRLQMDADVGEEFVG
jgi:hypothetical protein